MISRKILSFLMAFAGLCSPLLLTGQENLSQSPVMSDFPYLIARPNGEIMVAWTEGEYLNNNVIWYRTHTASAGWSPARIAVSPERWSAMAPQLAVDAAGNVHMAYMDGAGSGDREIYYIKYANGSWGKREMIHYSHLVNSHWPRIDVEGNRIYIVWGHNHTTDSQGQMDMYFLEKVDGGSWPSQPVNISGTPRSISIHPFLGVKNGNVHAIWLDDNHSTWNWNVYYNERINGVWRNAVQPAPSGWNQYYPALAVDDNGTVHVIYSNKSNPVLYTKKSLGGGWSSPIVISSGYNSVTTFIFIKHHNGYLHAAWRQSTSAGDDIFYARGSIIGQWEQPIRVSNGGHGENPVLDIDSQGRVHVTYSDISSSGARDIFYARLDQVGTQPIASFTAAPLQGPAPLAVSFDASSSSAPDGYLVSYAWDFGDGSTGSGQKISRTYTKTGLFTAKLTVKDNKNRSSSTSRKISVGQPPIAAFTASPTSGGAPLKVDFDASASRDPNNGTIDSYRWDFGDGATGQGKIISHTYKDMGTFTATLTVRNNAGLEDSASTQIRVSVMPTARFTTHPYRGEVPLVVQFDASASTPSESGGNIAAYSWDFGDGQSGSGKKVSHTYRNYGIFKAVLTVTDNTGKKASNTSDPIQALSPPTPQFAVNPKKGVAPLSVSFNASESHDKDGWIEMYKWDLGDGNHIIQPGKTLNHTYHRGGEMVIRLAVIDNDGLFRSTSQTLEVLFNPFPPGNVNIQKAVLEGLFFSNYINVLTWEGNSQNDGFFHIVKHRIYRKKKGESDAAFVLIKEGPGSVFRYEDGGLGGVANMESYVYGISFIDERNRESLKTQVSHPDRAGTAPQLSRSSAPPTIEKTPR